MPGKAVARTSRRRTSPNRPRAAQAAALSPKVLAELEAGFRSNDRYRVMQNAVTQVSVDKLANRRDVVTAADHSFSIKLDDWPVTAQKQSGRCWLFAGLNVLRAGAMKKMKLKDFEFSQNWPMFWDKLEKANFFLEAIIETAERPVGDRTVACLLAGVVSDGGQWNMFVNLVTKYGLAPKAAMPETESSSSTGAMNRLLVAKLRQGAKCLRDLHAGGATVAELRAAKMDVLAVVHRILCIHLGSPPQTFDWQWHDKDKKFHRDANMRPRKFAAKYVTIPIADYVCLVHDPRATSPVGRTFTVEYLGNVVGGKPVIYLNVDVALMKKVAMRTLRDGEPVWFGCDVCKQMDGEAGLLGGQQDDAAGLKHAGHRF